MIIYNQILITFQPYLYMNLTTQIVYCLWIKIYWRECYPFTKFYI